MLNAFIDDTAPTRVCTRHIHAEREGRLHTHFWIVSGRRGDGTGKGNERIISSFCKLYFFRKNPLGQLHVRE